MRRVIFVAVLAVFVLLTATDPGWPVPSARADGFTVEEIDGGYGFSFSGTITEDPASPLPVSAVGQFTAADGVVDNLTRTLNLGGIALVDSTFAGSAQVNPDGRGAAVFCGANTVRPPAPSLLFPLKTLEIFEFTLTGKNSDEIEFVGTGLFELPEDFELGDCPTPDEPPVGTQMSAVVIGIARQQDDGDDHHGDEDTDD